MANIPLQGPQIDTSNWLNAYIQGQGRQGQQAQPQSGSIPDTSGEGWQTQWQREPEPEPEQNWLQQIISSGALGMLMGGKGNGLMSLFGGGGGGMMGGGQQPQGGGRQPWRMQGR